MRYIHLIVPIVLLTALPTFGASCFLGGFSGNILTPDDVTAAPGTWEVSYHSLVEVLDDADLTTFGVNYGLAENLEVGASFVNNSDSKMAVNAKLRLLHETTERPMVLIGAFDIGGSVNFLDSDPGAYLVVSKNITPTASEVVDRPSKPLRLSLGVGSGVFDGAFAALDWTLQPQLSLMAEYFSGGLGADDNLFNAGIRYAAADALRVDAAVIDFEDFAVGVSYRIAY